MAELQILDMLVGFFCPTNEAASSCNQFIQNHSNILPPIGPLFYFLLFPAVFTILFILILMDSVKVAQGRGPGIKILLGVTAFIFIIISGWYPFMLIFSEFWYIVIIIMGVFWFVRGHGRKSGDGGGKGGKMPGLSGAMGAIMSVKSQSDEIRLATDSLHLAEKLISQMEEGTAERSADNVREVEEALRMVNSTVNTLLPTIHAAKAMTLEKKKIEVEKRLSHLNRKR